MMKRRTPNKVVKRGPKQAVSEKKEKDIFAPLQLPADLSPANVLLKLVRLVVRAFYGPIHIVLVEALLRSEKPKLSEIELCNLININSKKQVTTALGELTSDLLLRESKSEHKKAEHHRNVTVERSWSIDFKIFVEATKYRIFELMKCAKQKEQGDLYYKCVGCDKIFSQTEFATLSIKMTNDMIVPCDYCGKEVTEEEESAQNAELDRNLVSTLTTQLEPIITLLRYTETMAILRDKRDCAREAVTRDEMRNQQESKTAEFNNYMDIGAHNIMNSNKTKTYFSGGAKGHFEEKLSEEEANAAAAASVAAAASGSGDASTSSEQTEKIPDNVKHLQFLQRNLSHDKRLEASFAQHASSSSGRGGVHPSTSGFLPGSPKSNSGIGGSLFGHVIKSNASGHIANIQDLEAFAAQQSEHNASNSGTALSNAMDTEFESSNLYNSSAQFDMIQAQAAQQAAESVMISVGGELKPLHEITDEDFDKMSNEEFIAYNKYVDNNI